MSNNNDDFQKNTNKLNINFFEVCEIYRLNFINSSYINLMILIIL